jgi:hypothetical protein
VRQPILAMLVWTIGCGRLSRANVEGDVYVVTQGGDVKRGAANEVFLVALSPAFTAKWRNNCQAQRQRVDLVARNPTAVRLMSPEFLQAMINRADTNMGTWSTQLWDSAALARSPTGVNGHYSFEGVPPGEYWVATEMDVAGQRNWLVRQLRLRGGDHQRADLDNSTLVGNTGSATCAALRL